jgi:two-component system sensor histidine kinase and response regulator WspE
MPNEKRKRIVLVDDSPLILEVMGGALEQEGFEICAARDLGELERHLASGPLDLVLVDVQMPEAYGDDLALVMRQVRGLHVPMYLLSSLDEAELAQRVAASEIEGYIPKGLGVDGIVLRVKEIIGAKSRP